MTSPPGQLRRLTVEEYFFFEQTATERYEFRDGGAVALSGGTVRHSLIIANGIRVLGDQLRGSPCRVYDSNLRVRIHRRTLYSYPDTTVICGAPAIDADDPIGQTALNPKVIVEVLSPTTELYDRTTKFDRYRELASFEEYVLISQEAARIETYCRQSDGAWRFDVWDDVQKAIELRSLGVAVSLAEVYSGVDFAPTTPDTP